MSFNFGVWLIIANSVLVSLSSVCYKRAATHIDVGHAKTILKNKWLWLVVALAPCTLWLNVNAYRFGDVSALHPLLQLSLVWNVIFAIAIFKESISAKTFFGTALILIGAVFVTISP